MDARICKKTPTKNEIRRSGPANTLQNFWSIRNYDQSIFSSKANAEDQTSNADCESTKRKYIRTHIFLPIESVPNKHRLFIFAVSRFAKKTWYFMKRRESIKALILLATPLLLFLYERSSRYGKKLET